MMNAVRVELPEDMTFEELDHPSVKTYQERSVDLANCIEKLQIHKHSDYCKNKNGQCRFGYGDVELQEEAKIEYVNQAIEFNEKRNDRNVVSHNETITRTWRCNSNLMVIKSTGTILAYVTKYLTGKDQSDLMTIFNQVFEKHKESEDSTVYRIVMDILMRNNSGKLITIHEIFTRLLSEDLCQFSRRFQRIDVTSLVLKPNGKTVQPDYILAYFARPESFRSMSLYEFMKKICYNKKSNGRYQFSTRTKELIITFGLRYVSETDEKWKEYVVEWCLYFTPQHKEFTRKTFEQSIAIYRQTLLEKLSDHDPCDYALGKVVPSADLDRLDDPNAGPHENLNESFDRNVADLIGDQSENEESEGYFLEPEVVVENLINVNEEQIKNLQDKFNEIKQLSGTMTTTTSGFINRLSNEQQVAFDIITRPNNKRIIINGKAGTGKSFLINSLREHYGKKIVVCAPTGVAATNIGAKTLHATLHFAGRFMNDISSLASIRSFQEEFEGVEVLIIDEFTMMGARMLAFVNSRLQLAFNNNEPFGGVKLILCGDPRQLAPVGEKPLWSGHSPDDHRDIGIGIELYKKFDTVVVLKRSQRQEANSTFANICDRLGEASLTDSDYIRLNELKDINDFNDSDKLCVSVENARQMNNNDLSRLSTKRYTIDATDSFAKNSKKNWTTRRSRTTKKCKSQSWSKGHANKQSKRLCWSCERR